MKYLLIAPFIALCSCAGSNAEINHPSVDTAAIIAANKKVEKDNANAAFTLRNRGWRNNWMRYISVSKTFKVDVLGGIVNGKVSVKNDLPKPLAGVEVVVRYILANGNEYERQIIPIGAVPANYETTVSFPNTARGTAVDAYITSIDAPSFHFCYNADIEPVGNDDPYFCK